METLYDFWIVFFYIFGLVLIVFAVGVILLSLDFLFFYFSGKSILTKLEQFLFEKVK